jgi:hypothetical protein
MVVVAVGGPEALVEAPEEVKVGRQEVAAASTTLTCIFTHLLIYGCLERKSVRWKVLELLLQERMPRRVMITTTKMTTMTMRAMAVVGMTMTG